MIKKTFKQTDAGLVAQVTFSLPGGMWADTIYLVGDFNEWNRSSHPFQLSREDEWTLTIDLEVGRFYQFRYLCDEKWMNDNQADAYVHNRYGSDNFIVVTDPQWKYHADERKGSVHLGEMHE
jgi:1,4-alpha-glucan branching enzyme